MSNKMLGIAELLRKLLIDGEPLLIQVNRKFKLKIKLKISDSNNPLTKHLLSLPSLGFCSLGDGIDPSVQFPNNNKTKKLDLINFLKEPIVFIKDKKFTIKEIILYSSHIEGSIHAGKPENEKDFLLKNVNSFIKIGGYSVTIQNLKGMARVVLTALKPLLLEVQKDSK